MRIISLLTVMLLGACTSGEPATTTSPPDRNITRQFETAIADSIIQEIIQTLPTLSRTSRATYLREKLEQFDRSVDLALVSERIRQEYDLLGFLLASEAASTAGGDFISRVNAMATINWSRQDYADRLQADLNRLAEALSAAGGLQQLRDAAEFPVDSFEGRQQYLDALADNMFQLQIDQFDLLQHYEDSSLALFGEESDNFVFRYNEGELTVNLIDTNNLPLFELKPLAAFYGFPGLEALRVRVDDSLSTQLRVPGYQLGWASFMVNRIGSLESAPLPFIAFETSLMAFAWVDLKLHTDEWQDEQALEFLLQHTPYPTERLAMQVSEIRALPGRYLAAAAGKVTFLYLRERCLQAGGECDATFNQVAIERGVMPFEVLEAILTRQW